MVDFLKQIVDFIVLLVDLIINIVEGILEIFLLLPRYIAFVTSTVAYMPSLLIGFIMFGFFVTVLLFMVGRE